MGSCGCAYRIVGRWGRDDPRLETVRKLSNGTVKERHDTDAATVLIPKIAINTRTGGEKILVIADSRWWEGDL